MGHAKKAAVVYTKPSGERVVVNFGNLRDAEEYAVWMETADPKSKPEVFDLLEGPE